MRRLGGILIWIVWAGLGPATTPLTAQVQGRIRRVGLFEGGAPLIRTGYWAFVEVELRCLDNKPFDGELRTEQFDRDGDVATSIQPLILAPDGQWRPYELYFVPNTLGGRDQVQVKLYDAAGLLVKMQSDAGESIDMLVSQSLTDLPSDEFLIIDLSTPRKLPHVTTLSSKNIRQSSGAMTHYRIVRALSPRELPRRWQGLEMVDAIVWDDADPSVLDQHQAQSLIQWVRMGGRLLITAGRNWQSLVKSQLSTVLPVRITGVNQQSEALEFTDDIVQNFEYGNWLARQYQRRPILRCRMIKKPNAIGIPAYCPNPQIAYRSLLGRGMLTLVGASLRQLLPVPRTLIEPDPEDEVSKEDQAAAKDFARYCDQIVARNFLALPKVNNVEEKSTYFEPLNLFNLVRQTIGFQTLSAAFLIFAIIFAVVYTLGASFGTFWYLRRHHWAYHSWSAFAAVSLVGIIIGTGMVWILRGTTTRLWQTTVIDAVAGKNDAYATCLMGIRTPNHMRLNLRWADDADQQDAPANAEVRRLGWLRVMPPPSATDRPESKYVAPEIYGSYGAGQQLKNVPVRATLKEFQGVWHGLLPGTLEAKLVVGKNKQFGPGSYIHNKLGVDLFDCYILEDAEEIAGAGQAVTTRCLYLGGLPAEGSGASLNDNTLRQRLYYQTSSGSAPDDPPKPILDRQLLLTEVVKNWRSSLDSLGHLTGAGAGAARLPGLAAKQEYASLLLLSVYNLLEPASSGRPPFRRSYGRWMNCTHLITRKTAVLIGYSYQPSPAIPQINRTKIFPEKARTMYRFVIPVLRPD